MTTKAKEDTPTAVSMADTAALNGLPTPTGVRSKEQEATDEARRRVTDPNAEVFVSEGMRHDLETLGSCNDPLTGRRLTMGTDGKVTAAPRE
jgi:hypothetical protein